MKTLILGAGYGGLAAATKLKPTPGLDVTLIDQNPYHVYDTRLHEAAAHNTDVTLPIEPLLAKTGVKFQQASVDHVDLDNKAVVTKDGQTLTYDTLVIALGSVTNFFRIPGLQEHASELKELSDAADIYNFVQRAAKSDYTGNRDIIVGGAGLTGVELVTELAKRNEAISRETGLPKFNIYLVEAAPVILPIVEEALRAKTLDILRDYGIQVLTSHKLLGATATGVTVSTPEGGERTIEGGKIIWTGGIMAVDRVRGSQIEKGPGGRLKVDKTLRLPAYPDVFVIGDLALATNQDGKPVPTTAQHAGQEGRLMGDNLMRLARGEELLPFEPYTQGEFISLGGLLAVGWMQLPANTKLNLTGGAAHIMKRASEWRWRASIGKPV